MLGVVKKGRSAMRAEKSGTFVRSTLREGGEMYSGDLNGGNIWIVDFYWFFIQMVGYSDAGTMGPWKTYTR